jgi:hypothetical protein
VRVRRRWLAGTVALVPLLAVPAAHASAASVVRADRAAIFVFDPASHTRADLLLSRSDGSVTYDFSWNTSSCEDNGVTTLCAYTSREATGVAPSGTVVIASSLAGTTVSGLPVDYTQTDYTVLSTDDGSADDVVSEPVITTGSTTLNASASPVGRARTVVSRSVDARVVTVDVTRLVAAAPTLDAFGTSFGADSDDGSQLSSEQIVTTS